MLNPRQSGLFRLTPQHTQHSLLFAVIVGIITILQACALTGMFPHQGGATPRHQLGPARAG
jgi:hypothetical protein